MIERFKTRLGARAERGDSERGAAMIAIIILGVVLTSIIAISTSNSVAEFDRSTRNARRTASFQAAEAGVEDYVSKLTQDGGYFLNSVHPAESTRRSPSNVTVAGGNPWTGDGAWIYPTARNRWRALPNGYEYNIEVSPPDSGAIRIVATGRKVGSMTEERVLEVRVRPASISDYSYVSNSDQTFGPSATTFGKIYLGFDTGGAAHNLTHLGNAHGNLYSEGQVLGTDPARLFDGAQVFDSMTVPDIRSQLTQPINFNRFTDSLIEINNASATGGLRLDDPTIDHWWITFQSDGTLLLRSCVRGGFSPPEWWEGSCSAATPFAAPGNGAIYSPQSIIVDGISSGRQTVGSGNDIVIGGNLTYDDVDVDVLGLIARGSVIVAHWAPADTTLEASVIAQTGSFRSTTSYLVHNGTFHHLGSSASNTSGYMNMFATRLYEYDDKLSTAPPPYFPTLAGQYAVVSFRELAP